MVPVTQRDSIDAPVGPSPLRRIAARPVDRPTPERNDPTMTAKTDAKRRIVLPGAEPGDVLTLSLEATRGEVRIYQ